MSYTPKQQGTGGSAGQQSQQAKTLAGITQQMQNLVHGQNAIPQTSQTGLGAVNFANLNITLQQQQQHQQRFESIIKQQQLLFSAATPQIQQHFQQQIQQQQNAAKDLLNKSLQQHHQQQANGSTASASLASNLANQQLHQQLQAFAQNPANLMQHLQAYQYQMQQQQHQQKIIPLNQTQQSLTSGQLDVQNVTQQHMQQIQQTLQQQKLLATHTKSVSSTSHMKPPATSNNSNSSFSLPNAPVQMQSNNSLPNKNSVKGTVPPVSQAKQTRSPSPVKTPPIQTTKTHTTPSVTPKSTSVLPPTVKSPTIIYPQKTQNAPMSLTRTANTVLSSSSRSPALVQQTSRLTISPHQQISTKTQNIQINHGKSASADVNKNSKQISLGGKSEEILAHPVQPIVETSNIEAKTNENIKLENDKSIEKEKSQNEQKDKSLSDFSDGNEKEMMKVNIKKTQEDIEQKQEQEKEKDQIKGGHIQNPTTISDSTPSTENISQNDTSIDQTDVSEKVLQKVPIRLKPNQRRNIAKIEMDKNEKIKAEKIKEKTEKEQTEKDKCNIEKGKDEQEQKERDQQQQRQHKEKMENNKLTKEKETKENNENDKTEIENIDKEKIVKDKSIKEKVTNISQTPKNERKKISKEVSSSNKQFIKSGTQNLSVTSNIDGRRSKRHRLKTILYQSPLPELAYITKLSVSESSNSRNIEEKLILFYKSEYLAVRNAEGGFFICQTLQNVYKSSKRIRIRWFSEEKKDSTVYNPDFYDNTDLECVLTTVEMEKMEKDRLKLSKAERTRVENILKKAMDVEKGITPRPNVTEENPDGLDISLLKAESQISKRVSGRKRVASKSPKRSKTKSPKKKKLKQKKKFGINEGSSQEDENEDEYDNNDKEYKPSRNKRANVSAGTEQPKLRAQRSPLARTRKSSPIPNKEEEGKQSSRSMLQKALSDVKKEKNVESDVIPETNKSERPKRKAVESIISYDEELVAAKRLTIAKQTKKDEISKINDKDENEETVVVTSENNQITSKLEPVSSTVKSEITKSASDIKPITVKAAVTTTITIKTATGASSKKKKASLTPLINKISNPPIAISDNDKNTPDQTSETSVSSSPSTSSSSINRLTRSRK